MLSTPLLQPALTVSSLTCCSSLTRTRPRPRAPINIIHQASTLDLLFYSKSLVYFHSRPPLRLPSSTLTPILHFNSHPLLRLTSSTLATILHSGYPHPLPPSTSNQNKMCQVQVCLYPHCRCISYVLPGIYRCADYPRACDGSTYHEYMQAGFHVGICRDHPGLGYQVRAPGYDGNKENVKPARAGSTR